MRLGKHAKAMFSCCLIRLMGSLVCLDISLRVCSHFECPRGFPAACGWVKLDNCIVRIYCHQVEDPQHKHQTPAQITPFYTTDVYVYYPRLFHQYPIITTIGPNIFPPLSSYPLQSLPHRIRLAPCPVKRALATSRTKSIYLRESTVARDDKRKAQNQPPRIMDMFFFELPTPVAAPIHPRIVAFSYVSLFRKRDVPVTARI